MSEEAKQAVIDWLEFKPKLKKGDIDELFNIGNNMPVYAGDTLSHDTAHSLCRHKLALTYEGKYCLTELGKSVFKGFKLEAAKEIASHSAVKSPYKFIE